MLFIATEFDGMSIALRKSNGENFSVDELEMIKHHVGQSADIKTLYAQQKRNTLVIKEVICQYRDAMRFNSELDFFLPERESQNNEFFAISGFYVDDANETCTICFNTFDPNGFGDKAVEAFVTEMYKRKAISVLNKRLDGTSALYYRLNVFEVISSESFNQHIYQLTCTFRMDESGKTAINDIFEKYGASIINESLSPEFLGDSSKDLPEWYNSLIISSYDKMTSTFTLSAANSWVSFDSDKLKRISTWLYSIGIKEVIPKVILNQTQGEVLIRTINCFFGEKDTICKGKIKEFMQCVEEIFIKDRKKYNLISEEDTEYLPTVYLRAHTAKDELVLFKDHNKSLTISPQERFYFLIKMLQLGAVKVTTEENAIYCTFADNESGRKLYTNALLKFFK